MLAWACLVLLLAFVASCTSHQDKYQEGLQRRSTAVSQHNTIRYVDTNTEIKASRKRCAEAWVRTFDYKCHGEGSYTISVCIHDFSCTHGYLNQTVLEIPSCSCVNYDKDSCVVAGACPYTCGLPNSNLTWNRDFYIQIPTNVFELNSALCSRLNRDGIMCSKCQEGFCPRVYSYDLSCIKCADCSHSWMKFVAAAFIPLTVFYFIVVLFRINATNPYLYGFITFSQLVTSPVFMRGAFLSLRGHYRSAFGILAVPYTIWNLDFFRSLPLDICLNLTTLQSLALDYAIALYPLLLIVITYILIELHARGFRLVLWLWRPFHRCFVRFTKVMDIQSSIVKAFATFLLLSYVKLLNITLDILLPVRTCSILPESTAWRVYYDASYKYFSKDHLPYAILSIVISFVFILLPLIFLLLYPIGRFQRFLSVCSLRTHMLQVFADTFQGHFKDGTEPGTCDYRWFASFHILGRIIVFYVIFGVSRNIVTFAVIGLFFILMGILMILFQPYRTHKANVYHAILPLVMATACFLVTLLHESETQARKMIRKVVPGFGVFLLAPLIIIAVYTVRLMLRKIYRWCRSTDRCVLPCFPRNCGELRSPTGSERINDSNIRNYQAIL